MDISLNAPLDKICCDRFYVCDECLDVNKQRQDVGHKCLDVFYGWIHVNKQRQDVGHKCLDVFYGWIYFGNESFFWNITALKFILGLIAKVFIHKTDTISQNY